LAVDRGLKVYGTAGTPEKRAFVVDELGAKACFDSRGAWADDLYEALGRKRDWLKAEWARFQTSSIHPLSLVVPIQGIFGIHLLYLKGKVVLKGPA
jgi:hypothetical protein